MTQPGLKPGKTIQQKYKGQWGPHDFWPTWWCLLLDNNRQSPDPSLTLKFKNSIAVARVKGDSLNLVNYG